MIFFPLSSLQEMEILHLDCSPLGEPSEIFCISSLSEMWRLLKIIRKDNSHECFFLLGGKELGEFTFR
jgi:hypothetical protein